MMIAFKSGGNQIAFLTNLQVFDIFIWTDKDEDYVKYDGEKICFFYYSRGNGKGVSSSEFTGLTLQSFFHMSTETQFGPDRSYSKDILVFRSIMTGERLTW